MLCPASMLGYLYLIRLALTGALLPFLATPISRLALCAFLFWPLPSYGHDTSCPPAPSDCGEGANTFGSCSPFGSPRHFCHSERSVPRFWFCAKRRDTQSRNLSWMFTTAPARSFTASRENCPLANAKLAQRTNGRN